MLFPPVFTGVVPPQPKQGAGLTNGFDLFETVQ